MIQIDGLKWEVPCDVQRTAEMTASEISGLMLDRRYFNDVLGTYMRYSVTLAVPPSMDREYLELYETLTQPVGHHAFVMPYGMGTLEITARVESVTDTMVRMPKNKQVWRGIEFEVIANHPTKEMGLEEAIAYGFPALPEVVDIPVGTLYEATTAGWVEVQYDDADVERF